MRGERLKDSLEIGAVEVETEAVVTGTAAHKRIDRIADEAAGEITQLSRRRAAGRQVDAADLELTAAELKRLEREALICDFEDTLLLARRRFPGAQASLDALCRRFSIDLSARTKHDARLDCELLAAVYLELIGGRQPGLDLSVAAGSVDTLAAIERPSRPPRPHAPSEAELAAHAELLTKLKDPLWLAGGA